MSVFGKKGVGMPTILLHEGEAHTVTVELITGATYRGHLKQSEDSWNLLLTNVTATTREGKQHALSTIYIRGSQIRFIILPDMLQHAPMFERVRAFKRGITVPGATVRGVPPPQPQGSKLLLLLSWKCPSLFAPSPLRSLVPLYLVLFCLSLEWLCMFRTRQRRWSRRWSRWPPWLLLDGLTPLRHFRQD